MKIPKALTRKVESSDGFICGRLSHSSQAVNLVVHEVREGREWSHIAMFDGQNWIPDL